MERKLHPLFQRTDERIQIQEKFDPTPVSYSKAPTPKAVQPGAEISEFINETKLRMNRMNQKISMFEARADNLVHEVKTSLTKMSARFSERTIADHKVETLIERQNLIINNFEKRMNQMVKVIEDSQTHLLKTQAALDDARREIAKLKRL